MNNLQNLMQLNDNIHQVLLLKKFCKDYDDQPNNLHAELIGLKLHRYYIIFQYFQESPF